MGPDKHHKSFASPSPNRFPLESEKWSAEGEERQDWDVTMCGNVGQCVAMCGNVWQCVAMCGNVGQCGAMCGNLWERVGMCGNQSIAIFSFHKQIE
jgi:hypothetical protein